MNKQKLDLEFPILEKKPEKLPQRATSVNLKTWMVLALKDRNRPITSVVNEVLETLLTSQLTPEEIQRYKDQSRGV